MSAPRSSLRKFIVRFSCIFCAITLLAGCQGGIGLPAAQVTPAARSAAAGGVEAQLAEVTFEVVLPASLAQGQSLYLEMLDEVTGLALNPTRARMQSQDQQTFTVKIPIAVGSVIKYRYVRDNDPVGIEYTSLSQQVRYRLYSVDGPGIVHDTVTAWKSTPVTGKLGRIQGQVANKTNNSPVVNALVAAGGAQTLTSSDGSFLLEGLPAGTHNLVVYSLDGSFRTFQQGAVVAPDSTTPALVLLNPAKVVNVTFVVHPPQENLSGAPIRLVGNIYSLGNTFADLMGGMSVIAARAPVLAVQQDGAYSLTMKLPAGLDLRYKFTLGDGFWNAERSAEGKIRVRQLIVPDQDIRIEDTIDTWQTKDLAPVTFSVAVPSNTPKTDIISIQFNPFGWTQPIPMWPAGENHWSYTLYGPLNAFTQASYRYCRNDQCGAADAIESSEANAKGATFAAKTTEQTLSDTVSAWAWDQAVQEPAVISGGEIKARGAGFKAGAEFMTGYRPSWQPYFPTAFQNLKDIGANSVVLTPTWHLTHQMPPVIELVPGRDPLWFDMTKMVVQAQQKGLNPVIHPILLYNEDPQAWWEAAPRDDGWWQSWFDRYRTFLLYHADMATQAGAKTLIIGDESILPALPAGALADGKPSGVPGDAESRWSKILSDVRARYAGELVWFMPYAGELPAAPEFIKDLDALYVQISAPITKTGQPGQPELEAALTAALDTDIAALQKKTGQPVLLGLQYPSVSGAFGGCVEVNGKCVPISAFRQPAPKLSGTALSLQDQSNVYSALLTLVNQRTWITGFYAGGYSPAVGLRDMSTSVRNKPAGDVLWYWFPRLVGQERP